MSALLEYECRVPVGGYEVITVEETYKVKGEHLPPEMLQPIKLRMLQPRSERTRRFDLFEINSSAFLEFAQTPATEDGIKAFADRYGLLFPDSPYPPDNFTRLSTQFYGRGVDMWCEFIGYMHHYVELWKTSQMRRDFSKIILAQRNRGGQTRGWPVELLLKEDPLSASPRLCIRPESLYHALRAQLLLAIDGNQNLRACVQCRKWFTLEAGHGRSDKQYCSDACRMRAYRKRKVSG
jgi:hypothetical protein